MYMNIKEIDAAQLARWLEDESRPVRVVDVREMSEIHRGTVPGAEPMPLATVPLRLDELKGDTPLVLVCRSGARSAQACMFLQQQGIDNVYNLRGGIMDWARNGLPVSLPEAV